MRLFVAIDIPEDTRAALGRLIEQLRPACPAARWVRLAGMHVTLKFIGEAPEEKRAGIEAALASAREAAGAAPVELSFRGIGFFPNERRPRVLWAGIEAPPSLAALAAQIEASLRPLGFPREAREFHPHLTLARFDSPQGLAQLHAMIGKLREAPGALEFGRGTAREFHLYRSEHQRGGAVYTRLASFTFCEASA
jgi:2'-5' RNA ligase